MILVGLFRHWKWWTAHQWNDKMTSSVIFKKLIIWALKSNDSLFFTSWNSWFSVSWLRISSSGMYPVRLGCWEEGTHTPLEFSIRGLMFVNILQECRECVVRQSVKALPVSRVSSVGLLLLVLIPGHAPGKAAEDDARFLPLASGKPSPWVHSQRHLGSESALEKSVYLSSYLPVILLFKKKNRKKEKT